MRPTSDRALASHRSNVGAAVRLLCVALVAAPAHAAATPGCAQIVGLKDSSSGSTWWAQVLNGLPKVRLDVELLNGKDAKSSPAKKTAKIVGALSPSPCASGAALTGFTLNPHHAAGVDWRDVAARRPRARAVVWDRSNFVKKVVSAVLYEQPGCRSHNVQRLKQAQKCRRATASTPPRDFVRRVRGEACDSAALFETAGAIWPNATVHAMAYEDFRRDAAGETIKLFEALGLDASAVAAKLKTRQRTIKRSPEDLRKTFTNFEAIAAALEAASPATCDLAAMLRDTAATPFRCDAAAVCRHLKAREKAGS